MPLYMDSEVVEGWYVHRQCQSQSMDLSVEKLSSQIARIVAVLSLRQRVEQVCH